MLCNFTFFFFLSFFFPFICLPSSILSIVFCLTEFIPLIWCIHYWYLFASLDRMFKTELTASLLVAHRLSPSVARSTFKIYRGTGLSSYPSICQGFFNQDFNLKKKNFVDNDLHVLKWHNRYVKSDDWFKLQELELFWSNNRVDEWRTFKLTFQPVFVISFPNLPSPRKWNYLTQSCTITIHL